MRRTATKYRRGPVLRLLRGLRRHLILVVSLAMLSVSVVFAYQVESHRRELNQLASREFKNGDRVKILEAIDGDELAVERTDGTRTVVRVLGIKSFDPTRNDPLLAQFGRRCFEMLKTLAVGKRARLEVGEPAVDAKGRLLAYVQLIDDTGADESTATQTTDLGLELVRRGLTVVYTRYDFSRGIEYLEAEANARRGKVGLWSSRKVVSRVQAMKANWVKEQQEQ